jgi:polygalacturonase
MNNTNVILLKGPRANSRNDVSRRDAAPRSYVDLRSLMRFNFYFCFVLFVALLSGAAASLRAQDLRRVSEPRFPPTCVVFNAPLQSTPAGPVATDEDMESRNETRTLIGDLSACQAGEAVELALGPDSSFNAFIINPVMVPEGVSLIIDGGVTVFASRTPSNYQVSGNVPTCGTDDANVGGCNPLLSFTNSSGIYGYGVLDGRGNSIMNNGSGSTWWDLIAAKIGQTKKSINENNPEVIAAAGNNFTLYKITIRNPPWHTVNWAGTGLTVWGVKIQAPWNVTNTDGFDIHGSSATIYDTTISNGDDDIAFSAGGAPTSDITVDHLHVYSRDGITFLGNGSSKTPISNVLIKNMTMTSDVPSVMDATVNGMSEADLKSRFNLSSYTQALPSATGEIHGVNIKPTANVKPAGDNLTDSPTGATITSVTFQSICMQDIETPFSIVPQTPYSSSSVPTVDKIVYRDIHVLAPTSQFPYLVHGVPPNPANPSPGSYKLVFTADPSIGFNSQFSLENVVFDDIAPGVPSLSLSNISATGNTISTAFNVYPATLNSIDTIVNGGNTYTSTTSTSSESLAHPCPSQLPFTVGDLYISGGSSPAAGSSTNLQYITTREGSVTLNAVVQPVMSQATVFVPNIFGSKPGLVAVGSPALTNAVEFYEGSALIGTASISANGTLASLVVNNIKPGWHVYTAEYPADDYYATLHFGAVVVHADDSERW